MLKEVFDFKQIKNNNKKKFELYQINHSIIRLCDCWKVSKIVVEELNIKSSDKKKGKTFNRLCNNLWDRNKTVSNLKLLCSIHGIEFIEVNPSYSSIIGNLLYGDETTPDMVSASIEIARRGYNKFSKNWFYPDFNKSLNLLNEQWKQTLKDNFIKDWKSLFELIKKSKLKYRFLLKDCKSFKVFSHFDKKSLTFLIRFNII